MKVLPFFFLGAALALAQTEPLAFDVISIRPNPNCDAFAPSRGMSGQGLIAMECADLRDLILAAYGIYGEVRTANPGDFRMQVVGGPRWVDAEHYEIVAKSSANPSTSELLGPMLRSLLEDRFRLKVHRETKEGRVYKLMTDRNGAKLQPSKDGTCVTATAGSLPVCGTVSVRPEGRVDLLCGENSGSEAGERSRSGSNNRDRSDRATRGELGLQPEGPA